MSIQEKSHANHPQNKRTKLVIANWKMHGNLSENAQLFAAYIAQLSSVSQPAVVVCVPYPYLAQAQQLVRYDLFVTETIVNYTGKVTGTTSGNVPFELSINPYFPVTRDFMCYPSEIGGIETISPLKTWKNEFHPFISGKIDFKTGTKYPREIFLGNEGVEGSLMQCDNSGIVLIKGNSYVVDFN